jgi:hypothetical protein
VLVPRPPEPDAAATAAPRLPSWWRPCAAGNVAVAPAFHDRVRPAIDRTLVRLLGRRDVDHDDLAQRALIELFAPSAATGASARSTRGPRP